MANFEEGFVALGIHDGAAAAEKDEHTSTSMNRRRTSSPNANQSNNQQRGTRTARKGDMYSKGDVETVALCECSHSFRVASYVNSAHSSPRSIWASGPINGNGNVVDLSDRNLMCSDVHMSTRKCVFGGSDHSLYVIDVASGKLDRTLYSKQFGHAEWVSCVAYCPDGRVVSNWTLDISLFNRILFRKFELYHLITLAQRTSPQ
jgi:WD40 repeat protein